MEPTYEEALAAWQAQGLVDAAGTVVELPGTGIRASSPGATRAEAGIGGRKDEVLVWDREESWVEYSFSIANAGLYWISLEYYPMPGKRGPVVRELLLDGEFPFQEARYISLPRRWIDANPPRRDSQGDEIRPRQVEAAAWQELAVQDAEGIAREPLRFYLAGGRHTLRLVSVKEPVAIAAVRIRAPEASPPYEEVLAGYGRAGYAAAAGARVTIQAEASAWKSDPTVQMAHSADLRVEPFAGTRRIFNVFGDLPWRRGNQTAAWRFRVDRAGLYKIGMNILQSYNDGLPSVRAVTIDGRTPFREMEEVLVPFSQGRQLFWLGGDDPWLFYLEPGEHTLAMTVKMGPVRSAIGAIERTVREASDLQRKVVLITGRNPDPNREWDDLAENIPGLVESYRRMADDLEAARATVGAITGTRAPPALNTLAQAASQFRSLADKPATVPYRLDDVSDMLTSLISWTLDLREQPLQIDSITVIDPAGGLLSVRAGFLEALAASFGRFLDSFRRNDTGVGTLHGGQVLDVWVSRGREWAEIIKEMAEDSFTPQTGIQVNINILPGDQSQAILFNSIARRQPDVALGMDPQLPVDFGVRGALVDLASLPEFAEVASRFRPGALIPFTFHDKVYALPENQGFSMLFYRADILAELGLAVPETWDDVYAMLPVLQRGGMNFNYAGVTAVPGQYNAGLLPFLLQRGGRFYTEDELSALDEPEALAAFREWTELYTKWKLPIQANFYSRFRTGEMPLGISEFNDYVSLTIGAPELRGRWGMAPIPGRRRDDGTIDRSAGGFEQAAMLFSGSPRAAEGWRFISWWTSADTQARFGEELEALIGVEARWNTANIEAFRQLPWPDRDISMIQEQWEWFREQPIVLGGYLTDRHVTAAFADVVYSNASPREALERATLNINRELRRKQAEFGFTPPVVEAPVLPAGLEDVLQGAGR